MDIRRYISYLVLALLAFLLWNTWEHEQAKKAALISQQVEQQTKNQAQTEYAPVAFNPTAKVKAHISSQQSTPVVRAASNGKLISVRTDVLAVKIDLHGGDIVSAKLPKYSVSIKNKTPVQIFSEQPRELYLAQSNLISTKSNRAEQINYQASHYTYALKSGEKALVVDLKGRTASGIQVVKRYIFERADYQVQLAYELKNNTGTKWVGSLFTQLVRRKPSEQEHHFMRKHYVGAAISSAKKPYNKVPFQDFSSSPISKSDVGGWVAMQQHYFLSVWVPATQSQVNHYYTHVEEPADGSNPIYTIGFVSPAVVVEPGKTATTSASLYVGPELQNVLNQVAPGLDHTIDYGWLWPVSILIFWLLAKVHWLIGNWGWSIVITTILIKLLFHNLTAKTIRHGQLMRALQPKIQALKDRHGDDRQALSKATMDLHRKEGINPLGGCLPMLVQFPVFIALYYVLIESVQLRQAPFIFWIHDLSVKDPYYVLPILMGVSMFVQQRLTPSTMDPNQQKIMMVLPVVFTVMFLNFPAGLALYWFVSNLAQLAQQWYVMRTFDAYAARKKAKREQRKKRKK